MPTASTLKQKVRAVISMLRSEIAAKADQTAVNSAMASIAPAFSTETTYGIGDLYRCVAPHSAGAWESGHFQETSVLECFQSSSSVPKQEVLFANTGSGGTTYSMQLKDGKIVIAESMSSSGNATSAAIPLVDQVTGEVWNVSIKDGKIVVEPST